MADDRDIGIPGEVDISAEIDADWNETEAAPADQPEEMPDTQEADQPEGALEEQTQEKAEADQPEVFTLKHLDETKSVTRDEVVALAQQGLDYERIRKARDELQTKWAAGEGAVKLVEGYAKRAGLTVEGYLDFCREQELMAQGATEQVAKAQISLEKQQMQVQTEAERLNAEKQEREVAQRAQQLRAEAQKEQFRQFFVAYPGVKPDDIPKEVWESVKGGMPLVTAYTKHENERLRVELEAERKNRDNAAKSTGSLNTSGEQTADPYSEGWDD